ncbi:MAG TPA: 4Fe-4S dicluster domain-containing protein [Bacteroidales bacterium]|nr:4Fe-4S dicluster domain-containing protein [Bacteroidales bacterium]
MYKIAFVDSQKCSQTKCRLCTLYCPEPNTLLYNDKRNHAFVAVDRCKGCGACVKVCTEITKRQCIRMVSVDEINDGFKISKYGMPKFE